jgi:predicted amidophosphoribosyltransferase
MALQHRRILFEQEYFSHYYLCHYIPKSSGNDLYSQSLLAFKENKSLHLKAWSECALAEVRKIESAQGALVVRALHHDEQVVNTSHRSLDKLGTKLAHALSGSYHPECLQKVRPVAKLLSLSKAEREQELDSVYRFFIPERMPRNVLILDDILTSGSTVRAIIAAVLKSYPAANISVFTLGYTEYDVTRNESIRLKGYDYAWEAGRGWMEVAEDSDGYTISLAKLKDHIVHNFYQ